VYGGCSERFCQLRFLRRGRSEYRMMRTHTQRNPRKALILQRSLHVVREMQAARTSGSGWQAGVSTGRQLAAPARECGSLRQAATLLLPVGEA
jgi:hypothetical protein